MFALFQKKRTSPVPTVPPDFGEKSKGLIRLETTTSLLSTPRRQKLLEHIWQRTSLSRKQFAGLYLGPVERYAELVQQFPASESHHHAYPGGMLDHGLEIIAYALKLRQSHLLPVGTTPEDQAVQAEVWTAATAYAALLHDIGKIAVDLHVEYADGRVWHPWHGPLRKPYRFRYRKDREYRLHNAATGLLYNRLLDTQILDWLSDYPAPWSALIYVLAGQYEYAGVLGELVMQADQASVAQELGGDPAKALAAPKHALQRKLLEGLRYLLREELNLNQPQASDGWLTQDALWLVSKTVSDKLRAHLLSQGIEGIPANNTAVFNVLQDHGIALPTPDGKAIWKATVTSDANWSNSFTFLRLSPALIWESGERPKPFAGTVAIEGSLPEDSLATNPALNTTSVHLPEPVAPSTVTPEKHADPVAELLSIFDTPAPAHEEESPAKSEVIKTSPSLSTAVTPTPKTLIPALAAALIEPQDSPVPSGEHFMGWIKQGIQSHKLIINDAKALVHTVADSIYLVSPGIFQRYAQEHPEVGSLARKEKQQDWQWVQKRFEKLQLHRKQVNGLNIWTCEVTGPRKSRRLYGYLLNDGRYLLNDILPNNPYLIVLTRD